MRPLIYYVLAIACLSGCSDRQHDAIIEANSQLHTIEMAMLEKYNKGQTPAERIDALKTAVSKMKAVNLSNCPKDYQEGWNDVVAVWSKAQKAHEQGDDLAASTIMIESPQVIRKLNDTAKRYGLTERK